MYIYSLQILCIYDKMRLKLSSYTEEQLYSLGIRVCDTKVTLTKYDAAYEINSVTNKKTKEKKQTKISCLRSLNHK